MWRLTRPKRVDLNDNQVLGEFVLDHTGVTRILPLRPRYSERMDRVHHYTTYDDRLRFCCSPDIWRKNNAVIESCVVSHSNLRVALDKKNVIKTTLPRIRVFLEAPCVIRIFSGCHRGQIGFLKTPKDL